MTARTPQIALEACSRMLESTATRCVTQAQLQPAPPPNPNFDALAVSIAEQANATALQSTWLTAFGVLIGLFAIIAGIAWALFVKSAAEDAARKAASEWMDRNAEKIISEKDAAILAGSAAAVADAAAQEVALAQDGSE